MREGVPFKDELSHPRSAGMSLFSGLVPLWGAGDPEIVPIRRSSQSKVESPILSSLRTEAVPKYGEKGDHCSLFQSCPSQQPPTSPPGSSGLKESKMLAAGERGQERGGKKEGAPLVTRLP